MELPTPDLLTLAGEVGGVLSVLPLPCTYLTFLHLFPPPSSLRAPHHLIRYGVSARAMRG